MSYAVVNQTAKNFDGSRLDFKIAIFEDIETAQRILGNLYILDCINQMIRMEMQTSARMAARYNTYQPRLKIDNEDNLVIMP